VNIAIISAFRNAVDSIDGYCNQMDALQAALARRGDTLTLILGHGDSIDDTDAMLHEECLHRFDARLIDVTHGGLVFGSIEHPHRFRQLAHVGNTLLAHLPPAADVAGIVESDLVWDAKTMIALIDHLEDVPSVAPMIMDAPNSFYDIFAFRKDGVRFTKHAPYHAALSGTTELVQLDSAGSVLLMRGDISRQVRYAEIDVIVALCRDIYAHGDSVWLDKTLTVRHP